MVCVTFSRTWSARISFISTNKKVQVPRAAVDYIQQPKNCSFLFVLIQLIPADQIVEKVTQTNCRYVHTVFSQNKSQEQTTEYIKQ